MDVRRVVTGHDADGRAVFVADDMVSATTVARSSTSYHELWRADEAPTFPSRGANGRKTSFFPPLGGYRFFILTIPPGDGHANIEGLDLESALELEDRLPGILEVNE